MMMAGAMGSDPLLGPIPPLGAPPTTVAGAVDGQGVATAGDAAAAQRGAAPGNQQQLLDLIGCAIGLARVNRMAHWAIGRHFWLHCTFPAPNHPSLCHPSPARRIDSGVVDPGTKVALQSTVLSSAAPAGGNASAVAAAAALPLPLPIPGGGMVVVQQVQPAPVLQQQGAAVAASGAALPIASPSELKVSRRSSSVWVCTDQLMASGGEEMASSECLCTDQRMALGGERMAPSGGFFKRQPPV